MESRVELAAAKHRSGYHCAQAVACAYCDLVGMDEETMFRVIEGFGGGMGNAEGTCGAVSGACAIVGLKCSTGNLASPNSKQASYKLSKAILDEFIAMNGSVTCKVIKGVETGKVLRSCRDCVCDAARLVEKHVFGMEE